MSQPVFALSEKAKIALAESRRQARRDFEHGILRDGLWFKIDLETARRMHLQRAERIYREGMVEVRPDSLLRVRCKNCKVETNVARDVKTFRCRCSPFDEQWTCKSDPLS